ncbi:MULTISPECIES: thioesterase II family protein [unclassified Streptomyces]|uniref:thioesterase II family protein n=1 Tax=unclassified Streptomyces TaxID=2593676 RepID=UPI00093EEE5D|nr:alpha/beta fold hydrolase [Streptomyces sp. CB02414]OKI90586.1 thioesterase [Streptomyces sp. CB02414]
MSGPEIWFRHYRGALAPRVRLVCFPHAGGNARLFHGWASRLPADVELLAVRYPGRQERMDEPCVETMDELAGRISEALAPLHDLPLVLFGHSMGAAVAYEVALRLEDPAADGAGPALLLLSGRSAPHVTRPTALHRAADDVLVAGVTRLGTLGGDAYAVPELRELLLPVLRADYRLIETYDRKRPPVLRAPMVAYLGDRDPGVTRPGVEAWSELTGGGFTVRSFPGDHFYLAPREAELTADIAERLARLPVARPA